MIIAVYSSVDRYMSLEELHIWLDLIDTYGIECYFNCDFALSIEQRTALNVKSYCSIEDLPSGVEMVISYGGDGTFLKCVNLFFEIGTPILGVNGGRLGFLASVSKSEIATLFEAISSCNYSIEQRSLLYCEELQTWALNDCTIQKRGLSMIDLRVSIDGEYVADYMADGVVVATSTGSTAYSMSLGGAIIAPNCNCLIITPIAPHNLNLRSLVVASSTCVKIEALSRNNDLLITMDNREYKCDNSATVTIRRMQQMVSFVKLPNVSFYRTLRDKLMWGVDKRQT